MGSYTGDAYGSWRCIISNAALPGRLLQVDRRELCAFGRLRQLAVGWGCHVTKRFSIWSSRGVLRAICVIVAMAQPWTKATHRLSSTSTVSSVKSLFQLVMDAIRLKFTLG